MSNLKRDMNDLATFLQLAQVSVNIIRNFGCAAYD